MNTKLTYNGNFNLILGGMYSGKTSELVRRYKRHSIGGRHCLMIKYKNDTRYDDEMVVTHDKIKVHALVCEYLYELDNAVHDYDVICVDEVQFYKDAHIFIDKWANMGKIVEACGLSGTFLRNDFPIISKLIPLAENLTFLKAVCKETGEDAVYSNINVAVDKDVTEVIGGSDKYNATDRKTFFSNKSFYSFDLIKEYMKIYAASVHVDLDENILDDKLNEFFKDVDMEKEDLYEMGKKFVLYK